ncbi:hypothetical protein M569_00910, partial [Genlisea aurea]
NSKDEDDTRAQFSSKSRKSRDSDIVDGLDDSRKRTRKSDRQEFKSQGSTWETTIYEDETETSKQPQSKQEKKKAEENTLNVLSSWYQDGESESKPYCGDDSENRINNDEVEESVRGKPAAQSAEHANDVESLAVGDSRDYSGRDNGREKANRRTHKRRWDEPDYTGANFEAHSKFDSVSGKMDDFNIESERKGMISEGMDKGETIEKLRDDLEATGRGRSEFTEEDNEGTSAHNELSSKGRFEEHGRHSHSSQDILDSSVRPSGVDVDADVSTRLRDKIGKDIDSSGISRTPERIVRHSTEADNVELENEISSNIRRDLKKDSRDRDYGKETWKKKQGLPTRDDETTYDSVGDWGFPRRGRDRVDGRSSGRKDGSMTEAVKSSSKYGISKENYDVIEIQTKSADHGREDVRPIIGRDGDSIPQSDGKQPREEREYANSNQQTCSIQGSPQSGDDTKDSIMDLHNVAPEDGSSWRGDMDLHSEKLRGQRSSMTSSGAAGQSPSGGSHPPQGNRESSSYGGTTSQVTRVNRMGKIGRGRPMGRDNQSAGIPLPIVGSPFGALGLPTPGPMQSLPPNMSPVPGPVSPSVFIPPFQAHMMWPGARGVEMNMLSVPPGLPPPVPPLGPGFSPAIGNPALGFHPLGPGKGVLPGMPAPNFNQVGPGWAPPRPGVPLGKAPSRGDQNDYSQNFVDTGMRPQNFIRELELTSVVEDYPKLRELIQKKDEIVAKSASHPMYYKCDLREQVLSPEFFGTKFDVILVDPPWEEYVHRAPGVSDHMEFWNFEDIMNLKIEAIADTPSFIFLWVGDGVGLEQGRQCLKKWGFRRCEDICWVKTNKTNATPGLRHDSHTILQRSKEHCLMGIKGTVRRSTDAHIIHANIDTDVIIAEEPPYGSTVKPDDMYRIIEHFALGRRRVELFGEDHNIRPGWLTVGKGVSSSNFNSEVFLYVKNFADKDGKVWIGGGGRNPPPEAPHLVVTTPEIELLRPKSPMKNQQQQSSSIPLTPANSNMRLPTGTS